MLPMITLGIPGSPTTAILLGGMIIWGLRPGPLLFAEQPDFVWGLIGSMYVANFGHGDTEFGTDPDFCSRPWRCRLPF
jgi:TctA family transporter